MSFVVAMLVVFAAALFGCCLGMWLGVTCHISALRELSLRELQDRWRQWQEGR